jgi:hypothetical protein
MTTTNQSDGNSAIELARRLIAVALVLAGLYLAAFGNAWAPIAFELLAGSEIGAWLELIVPFLPMAFIGCGIALFATGDNRNRG